MDFQRKRLEVTASWSLKLTSFVLLDEVESESPFKVFKKGTCFKEVISNQDHYWVYLHQRNWSRSCSTYLTCAICSHTVQEHTCSCRCSLDYRRLLFSGKAIPKIMLFLSNRRFLLTKPYLYVKEEFLHGADHGFFKVVVGCFFVFWISVEVSSQDDKVSIRLVHPLNKLFYLTRKRFKKKVSWHDTIPDVPCSKHWCKSAPQHKCELQVGPQ